MKFLVTLKITQRTFQACGRQCDHCGRDCFQIGILRDEKKNVVKR